MSGNVHELLAVYVDGESKTGKGAAGEAISQTLKQHGEDVYYDVAGDFFRRYTAMVRHELGLAEADLLETGPALEKAAATLYETGRAFEHDPAVGDLQRPAISDSVATLAKLAIAQQAGAEWFMRAVQAAAKTGASVIVLDGRNPRHRVNDELPKFDDIVVRTALDLYMTCDVDEAARRVLLTRGVARPTPEQIDAEAVIVKARRDLDRNRSDRPFLEPAEHVSYWPTHQTADEIIAASWDTARFSEVPATITLDNTAIPKDDMLAAVTGLALEALQARRSHSSLSN